MNTKAVYVLVSGPDDYYAEELLMSLYSLKYHNPEMYVEVVADNVTYDSLMDRQPDIYRYADNVVSIKIDKDVSNLYKSRWLKTKLRNLVSGDYIFIDCDTIIAGKLDDIDNFEGDIGAENDGHINRMRKDSLIRVKKLGYNYSNRTLYYNSGVMIVKDNQLTRKFYEEWHKMWIYSESIGISQDQPSLYCINLKYNLIRRIGPKWNCQILGGGRPYIKSSIIIHYFYTYRIDIGSDCPVICLDNDLLEDIKISKGLKLNIKSLLISKYDFISLRQMILSYLPSSISNSKIFTKFMKYKRRNSFINNCVNSTVVLLYSKITFIWNKCSDHAQSDR